MLELVKSLKPELQVTLRLLQPGSWRLLGNRLIHFLPMLLLKARFGQAGRGFWVEQPDLILNARCVTVGNGFKASKGLRIWAIESSGGQTYSPRIVIGNNVSVSYYVSISAINRIEIHDDVLLASQVFITDHNHGVYEGEFADSPLQPPVLRKLHSPGPVIIERCCWIGERAVILPNVRIGQGSVVGSNAVVTGNVPPFSVVAGVPAKVLKRYDMNQHIWLDYHEVAG